jgi:hypothetical protein
MNARCWLGILLSAQLPQTGSLAVPGMLGTYYDGR